MLIISVKDNENHEEKRKKKKKRTKGTEAIAKGWELNDFVARLR